MGTKHSSPGCSSTFVPSISAASDRRRKAESALLHKVETSESKRLVAADLLHFLKHDCPDTYQQFMALCRLVEFPPPAGTAGNLQHPASIVLWNGIHELIPTIFSAGHLTSLAHSAHPEHFAALIELRVDVYASTNNSSSKSMQESPLTAAFDQGNLALATFLLGHARVSNLSAFDSIMPLFREKPLTDRLIAALWRGPVLLSAGISKRMAAYLEFCARFDLKLDQPRILHHSLVIRFDVELTGYLLSIGFARPAESDLTKIVDLCLREYRYKMLCILEEYVPILERIGSGAISPSLAATPSILSPNLSPNAVSLAAGLGSGSGSICNGSGGVGSTRSSGSGTALEHLLPAQVLKIMREKQALRVSRKQAVGVVLREHMTDAIAAEVEEYLFVW